MPLSGEELICPKFQPNIFDSSRCHDCLRQKHLHTGKPPSQQENTGTELGTGAPPTKEENDSSAKDDSDGLSVVSSYCDVSGGRAGYEESSLCILSPDCELYICDGDEDDSEVDDGDNDDSSYSQDQSECLEFSGFVSTEDDCPSLQHRSSQLSMTRLDPPHHRPNPRAWMDEARGRDGFSRHVVGSRGDREKESGYFSLGRAGGIRSFRDKSPPAPHRHSERGHPLPGNRSPEPKASIPFRNRDLGVPSQRRGSDLPNQDEPELCISPEPTPLERSIEVEAQVGPRSPSPTPFKQAESLVSSKRRGFNSSSYSRGNFSSSHQQSGLFNSSRQESGYSQSASPSRRPSLFNRGESLASLHSQSYTSVGFSQGREQRSKSPSSQSSFGRNFDNGGVQKSFKSIASTAGSKSLSSSYADLRGSLRKAESTSSLAGHGLNNRSSSPSRRVYEIPGQSMLRKTEANSSPSGCGGETNRLSRRGYDTPNQSSLHKTDVNLSSNGHYRSSCSPLRNGFDLPGPSILHKTDKNSSSFSRNASSDSRNSSPSGKGYDSPRLSMKHKEDTGRAFSGHGHDSRSSSPSRTGYGSLRPSLKHKEDANRSFSGHGRDSRNSSPSRTGYGSLRPSRRDKEEVERSFSGRSRGSRSSSPSGKGYDNSSQSVLRFTETSRPITTQINESPSPSNSRLSQQSKYETDSSRTVSGSNSRGSSPFKRSSDATSHSVLRKTASHESRSVSPSAYTKKTLSTHSRSESNSSHGFSRGAQHPLRSPPGSRSSSPIRKSTENKPHAQVQRPTPVSIDNSRNSRRSSSTSRYGVEPRSKSPESRRSSGRARSQSPSTRRLTSSQSSLESTESSHLSGGSNGFNKEEYAMMADLPKVKTIYQREGPGHLAESRHTVREGLYKPASHTHTKDPHREYESGGDQYNGGRLSRAHSTSSLNMQRDSSPTVEETQPWKRQQRHPTSHQQGKKPSVCFSPNVESAEDTPAEQPDLLNFKKGWMSKQDENGEWKKHWFVLTDAGLRYYRDSGAEEKDDLDGEIDLKSCVKVSEFDVEKNYGFQIHTRDAVFTLSAMTAGIRRNWIEVLRKSVRPGSTPDLTLLPDTSSDKENSNSRTLPTPRRLHSHSDAGFSGSVHRKFDYVELSPVAAPSSPAPAAQREAGEGQVKEHSQWQEERTRDVASNQWEAVISRKGPGQSLDQKQRMEEEIEKKWAEFERLPLKEMKSLPLMGTRPGPLANEALQREVASLRQQLEQLRNGAGGGGNGREGGLGSGGRGGECGPEATCGRSLEAMERAHRQALEELQKQHGREMQELQQEKERLLQEETRATAQVIEALKKAHKEELEREKARRLVAGDVDTQPLSIQQRAEVVALQRELDGLSEQYSQKCLELNRSVQTNGEREQAISHKERELEQLRKENRALQARLTEEVNRMRSFVTGQGLQAITDCNRERKACELEVLLRVKENEVLYLYKEISCLRNELQFLNTEKHSACERYREVCDELSGMKTRSEREIHTLREHLKLAMAALQEGQQLGNSLEH